MQDAPDEIVALCLYHACEGAFAFPACARFEVTVAGADVSKYGDEASAVLWLRHRLTTLLTVRQTCRRFYAAAWLPALPAIFDWVYANHKWLFPRKGSFIHELTYEDGRELGANPKDSIKVLALKTKLARCEEHAMHAVPICKFDSDYWRAENLERLCTVVNAPPGSFALPGNGRDRERSLNQELQMRLEMGKTRTKRHGIKRLPLVYTGNYNKELGRQVPVFADTMDWSANTDVWQRCWSHLAVLKYPARCQTDAKLAHAVRKAQRARERRQRLVIRLKKKLAKERRERKKGQPVSAFARRIAAMFQ